MSWSFGKGDMCIVKQHQEHCKSRLKSIRSINTCLLEIGIDIEINESEWNNDSLVFQMLPVGKQQVYWLGTESCDILEMANYKYRLDILMKDKEGLIMEVNRVIARNAKYVIIINPIGINFKKYIRKIDN